MYGCSTLSEPSTSDHRVVGIEIKNSGKVPKTQKQTIRDYTQLSLRNVARLASGASDPNMVNKLNACFNYLQNKLAPQRVVRTRIPENLVNPKVEKINKRRDRFYGNLKLLMILIISQK